MKRSTLELVVLMFAVTVCMTVLAAGAAVAWWLLTDKPSGQEVQVVADPLVTVVTAIVTGLLGLISGKSLSDHEWATAAKDVP